MRSVTAKLMVLVAAMGLPQPVLSHESDVESRETQRPKATIADMSWLEGEWRGTGIGGNPAGETFSFAGAGQMVGHFWQLAEDGTTRFYELITVVPDGESLTMRLKHFNSDLTGWEEKDGENALDFKLTERTGTRWVFGAVTFTKPSENKLSVSVEIKRADGSRGSFDFSYDRVERN